MNGCVGTSGAKKFSSGLLRCEGVGLSCPEPGGEESMYVDRSMLLPLYDSSSSVVMLLEGAGLAEEVETAADPAPLSLQGAGQSGSMGRERFGRALPVDTAIS